MKREKKADCPIDKSNPENCKYAKGDCNFSKKSCVKSLRAKEARKNDPLRRVVKIWTLVFFLIGIISKLIIPAFIVPIHSLTNDVLEFLFEISRTAFAAGILTLLIDLPQKLVEYEESLIRAITSTSYVSRLDEKKLKDLRRKITHELHLKDQKIVQEELLQLDEEICDYLNKSYYDYYRHYVSCNLSNLKENAGGFNKINHIEYNLINNNYGNNEDYFHLFSFLNINHQGEMNVKTLNDYFKLKEFTVSIDGNKRVDISEMIEIRFKPNKVKDLRNSYNYCIYLKLKEKFDDDIYKIDYTQGMKLVHFIKNHDSKGIVLEEEFIIEYNTSLEVSICYEVEVPKYDVSFVKRLQKPTKNFIIDYAHTIPGYKLFGQIFGTNMGSEDFTINNISDKSLKLEAHKWMLPRNGAMISMIPAGKPDLKTRNHPKKASFNTDKEVITDSVENTS